MKFKKLISLVLILCLACLTALVCFTSCEDKAGGEDSGKAGDNGDSADAGPQPKSFLKEAATGERNDYDGSVGYEFECLADMTVSAVGRPQNGEMNESHTIRIWDVETQALLASAEITPDSPLDSLGFKTAQLGSPLSLKAGVSYRIVSSEVKDGDKWYDFGTEAGAFPDLVPNDDCKIITPAFTAGEAWADYPSNQYLPDGAVNKGYTGVTFFYILD
ncbi:MAG: DUF4082 domain-containing protein [Oscillospiraceae bacterium]|nr:DUF4082 domain-containing protein [Oscillospiraceae bacterium]